MTDSETLPLLSPASLSPTQDEDDSAGARALNMNRSPPLPHGRAWHRLDWQNWTREKATLVSSRAPYYIPVLRWLPQYTLAQLKHDLIAGITVAVMIIPQSLAYSDLAGVPPIVGLYCAFLPILMYVMLGMVPQMSVGPEALCSILTGVTLGDESDEDERRALVSVLTFLVGSLTLVFGILRLGFIDGVLSRPVISAFVVGSALVIMVEQLPAIVGFHSEDHELSFFERIVEFFNHVGHANGITLAFSLLGIAFLVGMQAARMHWPDNKVLRFFPSILICVFVCAFISWQADARSAGVAVLGQVDGGFVAPRLPALTLDRIVRVMPPAGVMMVIGFVEASAIAKIYSSKYNYLASANRELVAFGVLNIVGSFFGAFPTFASLPRSAIVDQAGGQTQMVGFVVFLIVLLTIGVLLPLFEPLPRGTMAAIVFSAAVSLIHLDQVKFLIRVRGYRDLALMALIFIITLSVNIQYGMVVGLVVSLLLAVRNTTLPRISLLGRIGSTNKYEDVQEYPYAERTEGMIIVGIDQPLHFANTGQLKDLLWRIELLGDLTAHPSARPAAHSPIVAVIFDLSEMSSIDASATSILCEIVRAYVHRGVKVCFVALRPSNKHLFLRSGILDMVGTSHLFSSISDAKAFLEGQLTNFSSYTLSVEDHDQPMTS